MNATSLDAVISHWSQLFEDFQTSPIEFYVSLEAAIARRQIPDIATERIEYKEGGLISARREYLRVKRGKHAFDVCAAPFGTGFFFSTWLVEIPTLKGWQKILIFGGLAYVLALLTSNSFFYGPIQFVVLLLIALFFLSLNEATIDDAIMELPGIGRLYERLFKPITYYKTDTALMFQSAVHAAVLETIDALTSAKGIRSMSELERKPILKAFAKSA